MALLTTTTQDKLLVELNIFFIFLDILKLKHFTNVSIHIAFFEK